MDRRRAWIIAITAALISAAVVFLPPTLHTLHMRQISGRLLEDRANYDGAVKWALSQEGIGWIGLPARFKVLSKGGSILVQGREGEQVVCFPIEDDGELVRLLAHVQAPKKRIETLRWVREDDLAYWTEKTLDDHWQIIVALP